MPDSPSVISVTINDSPASIVVSVADSDLPPGGLEGQVLVKDSGADFHYRWADPGTTSLGDPLAEAGSITTARATTYLEDKVDVAVDGAGDAGHFVADPTYVDDYGDVSGFTDAAGKKFRRRRYT